MGQILLPFTMVQCVEFSGIACSASFLLIIFHQRYGGLPSADQPMGPIPKCHIVFPSPRICRGLELFAQSFVPLPWLSYSSAPTHMNPDNVAFLNPCFKVYSSRSCPQDPLRAGFFCYGEEATEM